MTERQEIRLRMTWLAYCEDGEAIMFMADAWRKGCTVHDTLVFRIDKANAAPTRNRG